MQRDSLRSLMAAVAAGDIPVDAAVERLVTLPFLDVQDARLDTHRLLRRGFPETVLGTGKTVAQIVRIVLALVDEGQPALVTRAEPAALDALSLLPGARLDLVARCALVRPADASPPTPQGDVVIVTAGTSDLPVAREAAFVLEALGDRVELFVDRGVAGVHRLLPLAERLREARVVIAVAGMEGALPSVLAGLVACPVIAVPTSVGYGASFGGVTALLAMLSSCAEGVTVVNIDNGFGAAVAASLINRPRQ